jgi:2-phospho-L-lactate guanylyltransferase
MYLHTLKTLVETRDLLSAVLVVSADEQALMLARAEGLETLAEEGEQGLNQALRQGRGRIADQGGGAVLVLPIDLPRLTAAGLREALGRLPPGPVVAIAPDRGRTGTNALVLQPLGVIDFQFGPGSFQAHWIAARRAGSQVVLWESDEFAHDVDVAEDMEGVSFEALERG